MDDVDNPRPHKKARTQVAASQRQRAVRACDECRRLKEKCEDGMPCRRCKHLGRQCDFNVAPIIEKRPPPLAGSIKDIADRAQYMETLFRHHFPDLDLTTDSLRQACDALSMPSPGMLRSSGRFSVSSGAVPQSNQASDSPSIEDEGCTIDNVDGSIAHYSGEFSHWNFSMHVKRNIDDLMAQANVPGEKQQVPTYIRVSEAYPDSSAIQDVVALLPPRPVANFLKRVVFRHNPGSHFIVEPSWVDTELDALYTNGAKQGPRDATAACVAVMVLAVGTQYAHLESSKRASSIASESQDSWELDIGTAFYQLAAKLLVEIIHSGSLLSVQACLLLGLYNLPLDASGLGYIYLNLAIKLAIQNGMHRKSKLNAFDPVTEEARRRIWWTAYTMKRSGVSIMPLVVCTLTRTRRIGIYHGRPASIHSSEIDVALPSGQSDAVSSSAGSRLSYLIQSVHLTQQAEAFLHEISLLRKCTRLEMLAIFRRMKRLKESTLGWWVADDGESIPATTRAEKHSRLERCLLEMFTGRPFILLHRRNGSSSRLHRSQHNITSGLSRPAQSGESSGTPASRPDAEWEFLVQDCVTAAKEAIEMCHEMQTGSHGLARSSYVEYSSCRAAILVLIAYSICYCTNDLAGVVHNGLSVMREMALAGESARLEVLLLEDLEASRRGLSGRERPTQNVTASTEFTEESYEGFADWYKNRAKAVSTTPTTSVTSKAQSTVPLESSASYEAEIAGQDCSGLLDESRSGVAPFNFDFLGDGISPNQGYGHYSNAEKDFLDSLPWIQD